VSDRERNVVDPDRLDELERLLEKKLQGVLSDDEIEAEKQRILAGDGAHQSVAQTRPEALADTALAEGEPEQNSSSSSKRRRAVRAVGVLAVVAGLTFAGWAVWGSANPMSSDEYKTLLGDHGRISEEVDVRASAVEEKRENLKVRQAKVEDLQVEVLDLEARVDRLESRLEERTSSAAEAKRTLNQLKQGQFSDQ